MLFSLFKGKCHKYRKMLSPYIDGRITPDERQVLESHLASCQECRHELESLRAMVGLLNRVPMESVPRSFTVVEAIPVTSPKVLAPMRWATAMCVVALALFFSGDLLHLYPEKDTSAPDSPIVGATYTPGIDGNRIGGVPLGTVAPTPDNNVIDVPPVTAGPTSEGAQPIAPLTQTPDASNLVDNAGINDNPDNGYSWPVHQIEFALLGVAGVMLATTMVIWRRGIKVSIKDKDEK